MSNSPVIVSVAGLNIRYSAEPPLSFSQTDYRGFAVDNACDITLDINIVDSQETGHDESDREVFFVGDCRGTEMPDHRWEVGYTKDGKEYIAVDFFNDFLPLNWLKLVFDDKNGTLYISRRDKDTLQIDPYIYPLNNILISRLLRRYNSFLIHSSVVDDNGKGYLFTAVSGTGKSTMARLWQGEGATIINDDMLAIRTDSGEITANNIPMPYYNDSSRGVALKGIFLISQSKDDYVSPISGAKATLKLLANTIHQPCDKTSAIDHLKNIELVSKNVPIYELGFKISNNIVNIIRQLNL
ncbi:MAG: hypothetical protein MJZ13_09160 [Bacteroidales bacterium]|nr:hypothetical protein [Bacteroidales bacterium]